MLIANPIYDVVFKYLLEDVSIAKELLATILEEEIVNIELRPQETVVETLSGINIVRLDFKAIIKKKDGTHHKVIIELQKAKKAFDINRFRRYLGDNYRKEDLVKENEFKYETRALPIITIYFLGFSLDNIPAAVVKINREYIDVVTKEILNIKSDFVELLTHESYLIQLKKLSRKTRGKLERVLQVFNPVFQTSSDYRLMDFEGDMKDTLVKKMIRRLGRAIASDEMRDKMDVEDEIDRIFETALIKMELRMAEKDKQLSEQEMKITEKDKQLSEQEKTLFTVIKESEVEENRMNEMYEKILAGKSHHSIIKTHRLN